MELLLVTGDPSEAQRAGSLGILTGVVVEAKPYLGTSMTEVVSAFLGATTLPLFVLPRALDAAHMVDEILSLCALGDRVGAKLPMTLEGLRAACCLHASGAPLMMSRVYSSAQCILADCAGVDYIVTDTRELHRSGSGSLDLIRDMAEVVNRSKRRPHLTVAGLEYPGDVSQALLAGASAVILNLSTLYSMARHPLTDAGIERYLTEKSRRTPQNINND